MVPTEATVPHPIQKTSREGTVLTVPYAVPTEVTVPHPIQKTSGEETVHEILLNILYIIYYPLKGLSLEICHFIEYPHKRASPWVRVRVKV